MAKEKTDDDIAVILSKAISDSEHQLDGHLSTEREEVEQYYRGELPKSGSAGDSKYVSRDVFDSVDSMRATVLEGFSAHSRIVTFKPEMGETVQQAKLATEFSRHVFFKENDGYGIMYDALTEGLLKRFIVAKVSYVEETEEEEYEFEGLTPEEVAMEVQKHGEFEFGDVDISPNGLYTGTFFAIYKDRKIKVELIQPEDLLVSSRSRRLSDSKLVAHRYVKTRSELLKEGYPKDKINKVSFSSSEDLDNMALQNRFADINDMALSDAANDEAGQETTVYEAYLKLDVDGTGVQKLWKVVYTDGVILEKEVVKRLPFASFVPLPIAHAYHGENFAKGAIPMQNARTVLIRQIINHARITNNPRMQVLNGTVQNPKELVDNRLGGIVNVRRMDGLAPLPQAPLNPYVFNLIQMIDEDKEEVTGISKLSQGLNKDAISSQNAEGMVEQLISASQQRTKIISRMFGEFVKDIFYLINATAMEYMEGEFTVEVNGQPQQVDPTSFIDRKAASIELTLSPAEADREAAKWRELDQYFVNDPQLARAYSPEKRFEVLTRALENMGIEDVTAIITPPDQVPPAEPSEMDKIMMEKEKAQIEQLRANSQAAVMKARADEMNAQTEMMKVQAQVERDRAKQMNEDKTLAHNRQIDLEELELSKQVQPDRQSASFAPNN